MLRPRRHTSRDRETATVATPDAGRQGPPRGPFLVRVAGASMRPMLEPGEEVLARACAPGALAPGDAVLIRCRDGSWLVHLVAAGLVVGRWSRFLHVGAGGGRLGVCAGGEIAGQVVARAPGLAPLTRAEGRRWLRSPRQRPVVRALAALCRRGAPRDRKR
ncbi:MAG: S24/S26 family peptidase [Planctomycetes bacterium]|nr:S24/S26 family peptidase [Planctomycetota bacterium]